MNLRQALLMAEASVATERIADLLASVISNHDASNHYIRTQPHG